MKNGVCRVFKRQFVLRARPAADDARGASAGAVLVLIDGVEGGRAGVESRRLDWVTPDRTTVVLDAANGLNETTVQLTGERSFEASAQSTSQGAVAVKVERLAPTRSVLRVQVIPNAPDYPVASRIDVMANVQGVGIVRFALEVMMWSKRPRRDELTK